MAEELERLFSIREVAIAWHVSEETIRRWVRNGDIPYTPIGPFRLKRLNPTEILKENSNGNGKGTNAAVLIEGKEKGTK